MKVIQFIKKTALISVGLCLITSLSWAEGGWIADKNSGCQLWNQEPQFGESVTWVGGCMNGKANGSGKLSWYQHGEKTDQYEGGYKDGYRNGQGRCIWSNGDQYDGNWKQDLRHGQGTFTWANGSHYTGEYQNDRKFGFGTLSLVKGDSAVSYFERKDSKFKGTWVGDQYVIQGKFDGDTLLTSCVSQTDCK